jgi:hypothetical protein
MIDLDCNWKEIIAEKENLGLTKSPNWKKRTN